MVETENTDKSTANSNNDKTKEKKNRTFKEKVKFYVTFTAASVGKNLELCCFLGSSTFDDYRNLHILVVPVPDSIRD